METVECHRCGTKHYFEKMPEPPYPCEDFECDCDDIFFDEEKDTNNG